jgi:hypothetical protein
MNSLGHACRGALTASARVDPATSAKGPHHERRSTPSAMPSDFSLFRTCPQLGGTRKLAVVPDFIFMLIHADRMILGAHVRRAAETCFVRRHRVPIS